MTNTTLTVTLLSDLHIGTGTKLLSGIDWYAHNDGFTYLADDSTLMAAVLERAVNNQQDEFQVISAITGMKIGELLDAGWLDRKDFGATSELFRYRLRGEPVTNEVREQIKTVYGLPYLPGSSLKGALRTVLANALATQKPPALNNLGRNRYWAAQPVEAQLFGQGGERVDANRDFGRAFQISDSQPVDASALRLRRAHIYPTAGNTSRGRSRGLDIDLETVAKGTVFTLTMHTPEELLTDQNSPFDQRRQRELGHWPELANQLQRRRLAHTGRQYARDLLIQEVTYFQNRRDVPAVHAFYDELATRFSKLNRDQFMMPLGWGGGWHTKTLNEHLRKDAQQFGKIVREYRLNPTGYSKEDEAFPKSRHLLRLMNSDRIGEPLGWCLVDVSQ